MTPVLALCDALFREIGRREHRFAWLRAAGSEDGDWLVVDAYYPSNRVVVCRDRGTAERSLCEAHVPQHGLYLLSVDPADLPDDPDAAKTVLRERLEADGWTPRPAPRPVAAAPPQPDVNGNGAASARAPAGSAQREKRPSRDRNDATSGHSSEHSSQHAAAGVVTGIVLIALVLLEAYLGVVVLGFGHGNYVLGFGLVLDACARVAGTLSATGRHRGQQAWESLLLGSLAAVNQRTLARPVAIAALVVIALGVVLALL